MADAYSTAVLADTPSAYYRLNESTTAIVDSSGNSNSMTAGASVTLGTTGLLNQAVSTDKAMTFPNTAGTANCISNLTRVAALEGATITVECWLKVTAFVANTPQVIVSYGFSGSGSTNPWALYLYGTGTSTHEFVCDATVGGVQMEVLSSNTYSIGTAYYLAWTYDGTTSRLFVNGTADGTVAKTGTINGYGANPGLCIGQGYSGPTTPFDPMNGVIDEVAVYANKVLTPTRILAHYTAGTVVAAVQVPYQPNYQRAILAQ